MPIPVSYHITDNHNDNDDDQVSDENHHELMDVVGSLVRPEIHENCIHSTGDVIIWIGKRGKFSRTFFQLLSFKGYTDETVEDVWVSAQPPHEPVPFAGKEDINILDQNLE